MWLSVVLVCVLGCTSTLSSSFDLGGVVSGNRMAAVPLGISLGKGELDVESICSEAGYACQNCTHAVTCVALPVGYLKVPLQKCPDDQTCNTHLGRCTDQHVPECQDTTQKYDHICEQVGIFPDAHDCRKFHLCSPPEGSPLGKPAEHRTALCPRHYGYNPQTAQCSIRLRKGQCDTKPVPECLRVGQNGVLPLSPNHYYVCILKEETLYPQVFLCPHGWFFNEGFCRSDSVKPATTNENIVNETDQNNVNISFSGDETNSVVKHVEDNATMGEGPFDSSSEKPRSTWIESLFSTEKTSSFAPDAFLADKLDLTNYESTDDESPNNSNNYDFINSFESFW